jgi:uncharacterized membrane protein
MRHAHHLRAWGIAALYAAAALAAGLTLPEAEARVFPNLVSAVTVSEATAIYSAIASGTITLTGIVFSLAFLLVQFTATAYSPRLVPLLGRDRLMPHALGVFSATFLFAIAALASLDRHGSGHVPVVTLWVVIALLVATVAVLIGLVQRLGSLQISRVLRLTGKKGREAIARTYPPIESTVRGGGSPERPASGSTRTVVYHGPPRWIQAVDVERLVQVARESGAVIELVAAVGDPVIESRPVLHVRGGSGAIGERQLMNLIELGEERTLEHDPAYAIRLLVDIAIRALSPAVNDPTTAVQLIDYIEDLLITISQYEHPGGMGELRDAEGVPRVRVPVRTWEDYLALGVTEVRAYGITSMQVNRRMRAMLEELHDATRPEHRAAVEDELRRLEESIARTFPDGSDRAFALRSDRQGIGGPARPGRTG